LFRRVPSGLSTDQANHRMDCNATRGPAGVRCGARCSVLGARIGSMWSMEHGICGGSDSEHTHIHVRPPRSLAHTYVVWTVGVEWITGDELRMTNNGGLVTLGLGSWFVDTAHGCISLPRPRRLCHNVALVVLVLDDHGHDDRDARTHRYVRRSMQINVQICPRLHSMRSRGRGLAISIRLCE
jgi:hypothetical protein